MGGGGMELFEKTRKIIDKLYHRRYAVTLSYTYENVSRALKVYKHAIENHLTLYGAIISYYGYRYRRMENFIRELGLYTEDGWLHLKVLAKIYLSYAGANPWKFELVFHHLIPEYLLKDEDKETARELAEDVVDHLDVTSKKRWYYVKNYTDYNFGEKIKGYGYTYCCEQEIDAEALLWKGEDFEELYAVESVTIIKANYVLHQIKLCMEVIDWRIR